MIRRNGLALAVMTVALMATPVLAGQGGEPVPMTEESPVRDGRYPLRDLMPGIGERYDKLDVELISITNLRDGSLLARATLSLRVRPNVSIYAIDTEFAGARGSELSYMQVRRVTTAGARLYF